MWQPDKKLSDNFLSSSPTTDGQGLRSYELTNHLGNVLATINDKGNVVSAQDYTPFGMTLAGRAFTEGSSYRFGFNGKEYDVAFKQQDYGMRIYRFNLGRFLSVDPLSKRFPWNSTYSFAEGNPIEFIDLDGGERKHFMLTWNEEHRVAHLKYSHDENFTETTKSWDPALSDWFKTKSTTVTNPRVEYVVHGYVKIPLGVDGTYGSDSEDPVTWTFSSESEMRKAENSRSSYGGYSDKWHYPTTDQRWEIAATQIAFNSLEAELMNGGARGLWQGVTQLRSAASEFVKMQIKLAPSKTQLGKFNTATVVFDKLTNQYYYGANGGIAAKKMDIHPELAKMLPAESLNAYKIGNCAECDAINQALFNGAKLSNLQMHTVGVNTNTGNIFNKPQCANCQATFKGVTVTSE